MSGLANDVDPRRDERSVRLENARVVTPDAVVDGGVRIVGDRIDAVGSDAELESHRSDARTVDLEGRFVLPGIVDLHGDGIENHLFPRDDVRMETPVALETADRENIAAGVTTKFHAVAFMFRPSKNRSTELGREIAAVLEEQSSLAAEHRLHARCELTEPAAVETVEAMIDRGAADLVSVMTHVPGEGQYRSIGGFEDWYADRSEQPREAARERYERKVSMTDEEIERATDRIIDAARDAGLVVATHDDDDRETLERRHDLGATIAEYPVTLEAAEAAAELEMTTAMGAPNLVQGGSQRGNLRTADAIDADAVDVLCADYHPASLLLAAFVETGEPLYERVARITAAPADAVGLTDRGRIAPTKRADLIVVDREPVPRVTRAFVAGREVYRQGTR